MPRSYSGERCDLEFEDIRLFPIREWEHPLLDKSMSRTLWTGEISLGDYGYITVDLTGKVHAQGVVTSQFGPGLLRNICLMREPASGEYRGSAELFVPANVTPEVTFGGSLHGKGEYLDLLPLLTLEGGLGGRGSAAFLGALRGPISLTYHPGPPGSSLRSGTFRVDAILGLGLYVTFSLDAWAAASALGSKLGRKTWNVVNWRWGRAWRLGASLQVEYKDGKLSPVEIHWYAEPMPIEDLLPQMLSSQQQRAATGPTVLLSNGDFPLTYRTGSDTRRNLTPRPNKDPGGLSTYEDIQAAFRQDPDATKAQRIDTTQLKELQAIQDPPPDYHVSITPGSPEKVREWAETREDESKPEHRWTGEVRKATVAPPVKRPK